MTPRPSRNDRQETTVTEDDLPEFDFAPLPYAEFDRGIDHGLASLVARWEHLAAPNASRPGRISRPM